MTDEAFRPSSILQQYMQRRSEALLRDSSDSGQSFDPKATVAQLLESEESSPDSRSSDSWPGSPRATAANARRHS